MATPHPHWMDIAQTVSWIGAAITAALGVIGFFITQYLSRQQRRAEITQREESNEAAKRELEWRRASAAWFSIQKLESDKYAGDAMLMLDWDGRSFPSDPSSDQKWSINRRAMLRALRTKGESFDPEEVYVRDAFDRLFWHFEWVQSQIESGLIELRHVRFPFAYLAAHMRTKENRPVFDEFLKEYCYAGASRLIDELEKQGLLPDVPGDYQKRFIYAPKKRRQTESPSQKPKGAGRARAVKAPPAPP